VAFLAERAEVALIVGPVQVLGPDVVDVVGVVGSADLAGELVAG
jgi:hypothetical protein